VVENLRAAIGAGFFIDGTSPNGLDLLAIEDWFTRSNAQIDMANGSRGRIGKYSRLRSKLILGPSDKYYALYGDMDEKRSDYLEDCWRAYAQVSETNAILAIEGNVIAEQLFRDLLRMPSARRFLVAYYREGSRFHDAVISDMGLGSNEMSRAVDEATCRWSEHLRSGSVGSKLRDVYPLNAFRPHSICVGSIWLEEWIRKNSCGRLTLDSHTGMIVWQCTSADIELARFELKPCGCLVV
jgi:hypothetical protein